MIEQIRIIIEQCNKKGKKMEENRININCDVEINGNHLESIEK